MDILKCCPTCYSIALNCCADKIKVKAGLTHATDYYYTIIDKFLNNYTEKFTTDSEGNFEIETKLYQGMFTPHAGAFDLQIYERIDSCEPVELTLCDIAYECISMTFIKVTTSESITTVNIPCECEETA